MCFRDPLPDVLRQQFPVAPQTLRAMGCQTYAVPGTFVHSTGEVLTIRTLMLCCDRFFPPPPFHAGFEADDVLATLTRLCHSKQMNVVIVSIDKDMLQLIRPGVHIMNPRTRVLVGEQDVVAKYGVAPSALVDFAALMGDR